MKKIFKNLFIVSLSVGLFSACSKTDNLSKVEENSIFEAGVSPVMTSSVAAIAPAPADSNNVAVTFNWTSPKYAQDPSLYKYILEIDSTGRNFSKAFKKTMVGNLSTTMIAKDLNALALSYGFAFNTAYDMDVRIVSSYGNNNEKLSSNTVKVKYTPYLIPPKVALPITGKLFLVGDASQGGWNNPVPVPTQEFAKIDATTFGGVFNLVGGNQYLVLPLNGSWDNKFSVQNNTIPNLSSGGDFGFNLPQNFPAPAVSGWYKIELNFQSGKFKVTPFTSTLPNNLFIVGDATAGGWNNPVPVPTQQLTRLNSAEFKATALPMTGNKEYLLLPVNGDWSNKYAVQDNSLPGLWAGGDFGYNFPQNFKGPTTNGNYNLTVNFFTGKFKVQ